MTKKEAVDGGQRYAKKEAIKSGKSDKYAEVLCHPRS